MIDNKTDPKNITYESLLVAKKSNKNFTIGKEYRLEYIRRNTQNLGVRDDNGETFYMTFNDIDDYFIIKARPDLMIGSYFFLDN